MKTNPSLEQTIALITGLMSSFETQAFQQDGFADLSMRQVFYLETIIRLEHPSFSELAEALGITRASVTALAGKLIRSGYVDRQQDGEDRRSYHLVLTEKGKEFSRMHTSLHQHIAQTLTQRLNPDEISQLTRLLQKMAQG
jgi:DNA-binding MarR family transcriptional regulator